MSLMSEDADPSENRAAARAAAANPLPIRVTFNRPESMNAINRQMTRELIEACRQAEEDSGIRIAIFTGAGERAFSAGMDLKERAETVSDDRH